jgi:hypothetical protein
MPQFKIREKTTLAIQWNGDLAAMKDAFPRASFVLGENTTLSFNSTYHPVIAQRGDWIYTNDVYDDEPGVLNDATFRARYEAV